MILKTIKMLFETSNRLIPFDLFLSNPPVSFDVLSPFISAGSNF